jgi:hypothetical protein
MAGRGSPRFKEEAMPARTTRQQARDRLIRPFMASLDKVIPPDEAQPLRGSTFRDWEGQAAELKRALIPALLEERSALADNARVTAGGHCPHCGSASVYLEKQATRPEVLTPGGPVVVERRHGRCRTCGGPFSPAEP